TRGVGVGGRGGDGGEEEATAVGRQPQGEVEVVGGEGLVVVGAVEPGRAVRHPADLLDVVEVLVGFDVLAALEQHVLEEVGEAGPARPLVLRADVIPEVDSDQREAAIEVEDEAQPVPQGVLGEAEVGVGGHSDKDEKTAPGTCPAPELAFAVYGARAPGVNAGSAVAGRFRPLYPYRTMTLPTPPQVDCEQHHASLCVSDVL